MRLILAFLLLFASLSASLLLRAAPEVDPEPVTPITQAELLKTRSVTWNGKEWPVEFRKDGVYWCGNYKDAPGSYAYWYGSWNIPGPPRQGVLTLWEQKFQEGVDGVLRADGDGYEVRMEVYFTRGKLSGVGWVDGSVVFNR